MGLGAGKKRQKRPDGILESDSETEDDENNCDVIGIPPQLNEFQRKTRAYSTRISSRFKDLLAKLADIGDKIPFSLQLDGVQDARLGAVYHEAGLSFSRLVRVLQENIRPPEKLGFNGVTMRRFKHFREKDDRIPQGLYTIIDFLHGMVTANGTL